MKDRGRSCLWAVGLLWLLVSSAVPAGARETGRKGLILTTFQPLYSFAAKVVAGSPNLEVVNLAPRDLGPHDFDLDDPAHADRCRDLARRADAVVTLRSLALAKNFDRLYPWCRRVNIRIVEIDPSMTWGVSAPKLALIQNPGDTAREREHAPNTETSTPNPHVWLSLTHAVRMIGRIEQDVIALDPENEQIYHANGLRFQAELRKLKAEYESTFARLEDTSVVALTEGFPYLTADFAVDVADYILEPASPQETTRRVSDAGVRVVIAEEEPSQEVSRAVEQAGARVVVLTTMEEGWGRGDDLDPDGYLEAMRHNLARLSGALGE